MASQCAVSPLFPNSLQPMVRQAIRQAHGREQSRTAHHPEHGRRKTSLPPQKLTYQWIFSYLTGCTGSGGFSFRFLSFRLPATLSLARRAGTKLRKKNPAPREIHLSCCVSMVCHAAHLWFDPGALRCRLYRYGGFVLPSPPASPERTRTRDGGQAGRTQEEQNHVNPVYPVSYMKKDT